MKTKLAIVAIVSLLLIGAGGLAAYAQEPTPVQDISGLLVAVAGFLGALSVFVGALVPYISKVNKQAGEKAALVADSLKETDFWIVEKAKKLEENEARINLVLDYIKAQSPDAAKALDENLPAIQAKLREAKERVNEETEEVKRLHQALPGHTE